MTYTPDTYSDYKASVKFTTTANITLSGLGTQAGGDWAGSLTSGDRVLVKDQSTGSENGIYEASAGSWVRARDADQDLEITSGMMATIEGGATLADTTWIVTNDGAITIGSTALTFAQISGGSTLDSLSDVDVTGAVDGSLLRYEATGSVWNDTTAGTLLLSDAGQLLIPTTGSGAGILLGGDVQLYRSAANILFVASGDKIQQNAAPTVGDDLVNKTYADTKIASSLLTTKGDLVTRTASTVVRQAVPADGNILVGDSAQTNGWDSRVIAAQSPFLIMGGTSYLTAGVSAGTRLIQYGTLATSPASDLSSAPFLFWSGAALSVTGWNLELLLLMTSYTNNTSVGTNTFTGTLRPVTALAGGAGVVTGTTGSAVTGSAATIVNPAIGTRSTGNSGWFSAPAFNADAYFLFIANSAAMPASSHIVVSMQLFGRYVN